MEATDVAVVTQDQAEEANSTEGGPTAEAVIAKAEALVVPPPTEEDLIAKKEAVFNYVRNHKIVPQVLSKRTSSRPLCAGCAFGIRQETKPKFMDDLPFHPNCLKAHEDHAFALKLSPRYLAAAVPIMTTVARAKYAEEPPVDTEDSSEGADGGTVEDVTTDLVEEAVKKGRGKKSA